MKIFFYILLKLNLILEVFKNIFVSSNYFLAPSALIILFRFIDMSEKISIIGAWGV